MHEAGNCKRKCGVCQFVNACVFGCVLHASDYSYEYVCEGIL